MAGSKSGPPAKPAHIRKLEGDMSKGKSPVSKDPPVFLDDEWSTRHPGHLSRYAIEEWERMEPALRKNKLLTAGDVVPFAMWCEAYATWRWANEQINAPGFNPISVSSRTGYETRHPMMGIRSEAFSQLHKMMGEFGFTPSSRVKMSLSNESGDGMDAFLKVKAG